MKFILLNILMTLIIMICSWKNKKQAFFLGCVCGFIPGIGLFLGIGYCLMEKYIGSQEGKIKELQDSPHKGRRKGESLEKMERLVAVSEALALNDTKIKKEVLIGVLREDKSKYIEPLKVALQDEDTEASHYAAVALMEIKDDFHKDIEILSARYKKQPDDMIVLAEYAAALEVSIKSGLNDIKRLSYLETTYASILEQLLKEGGPHLGYYTAKIKCEMRRKNFETAYTYCLAFKEAFEEHEEPYLCLMHYYYLTKNQASFKAIMDELKYSTVTLSRTGIQNMRFWLGGMV